MAAALKERCPSKIDIGPVYNVEPHRRAAYQSAHLLPGCACCTAGSGLGEGFAGAERARLDAPRCQLPCRARPLPASFTPVRPFSSWEKLDVLNSRLGPGPGFLPAGARARV